MQESSRDLMGDKSCDQGVHVNKAPEQFMRYLSSCNWGQQRVLSSSDRQVGVLVCITTILYFYRLRILQIRGRISSI